MADVRRRPRGRADFAAVAVGLAVMLIVAIELFVPPRLGIADNGDFEKLTKSGGFARLPASYRDLYWNYFDPNYLLVRPAPAGEAKSSELVFVFAARALSLVTPRGALFDVGVLGGIHLAFFAFVLAAGLASLRKRGRWTRATAAIVAAFFFTDAFYTSSFASFYMQTASLLFLLATACVVAAAIARPGFRPSLFFSYALFAALFAASKTQEAAGGIVLALFAFPVARACFPRRAAVAGLAAAALVAGASLGRYDTPSPDRRVALYQIVFTEILPHSPDPSGDLVRLGIPQDLSRCIGTNAYHGGTCLGEPEVGNLLGSRLTFRRVAELYAARPGRAIDLIRRGARELFATPNLGQFPKESGRGPKARARAWAWWSRGREAATRGIRLPAALLLFGGTAAAAAATYSRASASGRLFREALFALIAVAAADFLVCVLADAHYELARHLYAADAGVDLLLLADIAWIVDALERRRGIS